MGNSSYTCRLEYYWMEAFMSTSREKKILSMMLMQDAINRQIDEDWAEKGREWYRAIWIECAELMEHYGGWKWWKKDHPDMEQVLLEIVDIWHFGLSDLLVTDSNRDLVAASVTADWYNKKKGGNFHDAVESLAQACLSTKRFPVGEFGAILRACDISFDNLYHFYVGKNVLNRFRQDYGYKTGGYIKDWNGKEDNEGLSEILMNSSFSADNLETQIYAELESIYIKIIK